MKRITLRIILLAVSFLFLSNITFSQAWTWDWASTITAQVKGSMIESIHVDQYNNIYCRIPYSGPIYIGDTSFNYGSLENQFGNYAFAKYNVNGEFQFAVNTREGDFHYPDMVTDINQNLYIAGDFRHHIWVNDSLIIMNPGSSGNHGEVLLCKINPDNEVVWTGLISCQWDDNINSMCTSPDNQAIYLLTEHYANGDPHILNYFNQDTSLPFYTPMNTVVKVDTNCNILWKKEIRSEYLGTGSRKIFNGLDNNLYVLGNGYAHFNVDEDTIYHPYLNSGEAVSLKWLLKFDHEGNLLDGFYMDWDIWFYELEIDLLGNIYLTGTITDTSVIGQDTIIVPEGLYYRLIGKFNSALQPHWYQVFEEQDDQNIYFSQLELDQDHLIFAGHADGDLQVGDSTFQIGNYREVVVGEYNHNGELVNIITTECEEDFTMWSMILDNCKNPIICGMFMGDAELGQQIFSTYNYDFEDGYLAKIQRAEPNLINLGNDTSVCEAITIQAPTGYLYYLWNNQPGSQETLEILETGEYSLACGDGDGCWYYDTIHVSVDFADDIYLGPDTSIKENDTIIFEVFGDFEDYLWSDFTTNSEIQIIGSDYGIGIHNVWIEATKGGCVRVDTILLEVKSEFGLNDQINPTFRVYPNPFSESFSVHIPIDTQQIGIYRLDGSLLYEENLTPQGNKTIIVSLEGEPAGIYMIRIKTKDDSISEKLIKK